MPHMPETENDTFSIIIHQPDARQMAAFNSLPSSENPPPHSVVVRAKISTLHRPPDKRERETIGKNRN